MKNEFLIYSSIAKTQKNDDKDNSGRLMLEGIASTTSRDLQDEIVSMEAIKSMVDQAVGLNIHANHEIGLEDVIGSVKAVEQVENKLKIKFLITKKHTPAIQDMIETGINLGLSIGGYVTDYDNANKTINGIDLKEISLTPSPANYDTFGTVVSEGIVKSTCLTGACYNIIKNNGDLKMSDENNNDVVVEEPTNEEEIGEVSATVKSEGIVSTDNETKPEDGFLTQDKVIELFNELMSERQDSIIEMVTASVENEVKNIVNEALEGNQAEEPAEEENKAVEDDEKPEDSEQPSESSEDSTENPEESEENESETDDSEKPSEESEDDDKEEKSTEDPKQDDDDKENKKSTENDLLKNISDLIDNKFENIFKSINRETVPSKVELNNKPTNTDKSYSINDLAKMISEKQL